MVVMLEDISENTKLIAINSITVKYYPTMQAVWSVDEIKNEPMFRGASWGFAAANGGPITKEFLNAFMDVPWQHARIDSKVVMLMDGFWPCIPGWHHDDVPRERSDGQPEYHNPSYRTNHLTAIVGTDPTISCTEFAVGQISFPEIPMGQKYYKEWSPMVDEAIALGFLDVETLPYGEIRGFDDRTWHRGTRSHGSGWRWFVRATIGSTRPFVNEIRNQVQVYMSDPIEGW